MSGYTHQKTMTDSRKDAKRAKNNFSTINYDCLAAWASLREFQSVSTTVRQHGSVLLKYATGVV